MNYCLAVETMRLPGCFPPDSIMDAARFVVASNPVNRRDDVRLAKRVLKGDFARRALRRAAKRAAQSREA